MYPSSQYAKYAQVLETRILRGDYALRELPTEHGLAHEFKTTRKTARRALQHLMDKGILVRKPYGRLEVPAHNSDVATQLAILIPAFLSNQYHIWRHAAEKAATKLNANIHTINYSHWDDPSISQALSTFAGAMIVPSSAPIPPMLLERFSKAGNVVILDGDLSAWGIPSVQMLPPVFVHRLGDHLYELGHRHIDCLNVQPHDQVIRQRIEQWQAWAALHQVKGRIIDQPVEPGEDTLPVGYQLMKSLLERGDFEATALICMTQYAAKGAMRAIYEKGLGIGKAISVCAVSGSQDSQYEIPTYTGLLAPEPDKYVEACVRWLSDSKKPWPGSLLLQPSEMPVFVGESTGPVRV